MSNPFDQFEPAQPKAAPASNAFDQFGDVSLEDFAASEARGQGLDPELVRRTIHQESGGNPNAVSPKGARGPMQLMPATAAAMGVDPNDPYDNVRGGVHYMKQQMDEFGSPDLALAAYNAGPGAVRKYGGIPPYAETQNYVRSITNGYTAPANPLAPGEATARINAGLHPSLQPPQPLNPGDGVEMFLGSDAPTGGPIEAKPKVDEGLGFAKGLFKPLDNAAWAAEQGLRRVGFPVDALDRAAARIGMPSTDQAIESRRDFLRQKAQEGVVPGKIGDFAGNVVGTLPTLMLPGGLVAQGAASGALTTDNSDAAGVARDAGFGAVGSVVGGKAMQGVGKALKGITDPAVQLLRREGVPMTLGQMTGGAVQRVEDAVAGFPVVGDIIKGAQRRSFEGLNVAALNRSLAPIGESLPKGMKPGREAVQFASDRLGARYNELLPHLNIKADGQYASSMQRLRRLAQNMPADHVGAFDNIIKTEVASRFSPNGSMSGEAMKDVESALGQHIRDIRMNQNSTKWDRDLARGLEEAQDQIRKLVIRSNPTRAPELRKINTGYANYKRVERAAGAIGATEGVFSPANLAQAVRSTASKSSYAKGNALMEDLSDAAKAKLPATMPDSGSSGRAAVGLGIGALAAKALVPPAYPLLAAGAAAAALYTKSGQKILAPLLTSRTPAIIAAGRAAGRLAPYTGSMAATAAVQSRR